MNFKTTAVLLVLLLAVGGYVFLTRDKGTSTATDRSSVTPPAAKPLLAVAAGDVDRITVADAQGKVTLEVHKANGTWRLVRPVMAAADSFSVQSLLDQLTTDLKPTNVVKAAGPDAPATGVDHPRYTVWLATAKDATKLLIGDKLSVGDGVYAQAAGSDQVAVVPVAVVDALARPASDLRNKQLFGSVTAADVQQVTVEQRGKPPVKLAKTNGAWREVAPAAAPADAAAVDELLSAVVNLYPSSFVDDPADASGLAKPRAVVSFSTAAPGTQPSTGPATAPVMTTVTFGGYDGVQKANVFASVSDGTIVKVPASSLEAVEKSPLDLRDKSVLDIDPAKVTRLAIEVQTPAATQPVKAAAVARKVVLTRRPPTPVMMGPAKPATKAATAPTTAPATVWLVDGQPADDAKVTAVLSQLHPLKADKYLPANGIKNPARRLTVTLTTGTTAPTVVRLDDPGHDLPLVGDAAGLTFNLPAGGTLGTDLSGDFKKAQ